VSPGPEAFPEGTLEIALVCAGRERAVARLSLAAISRAAGRDDFPHVTGGPPRGPAGNTAGPGRLAKREQPLEESHRYVRRSALGGAPTSAQRLSPALDSHDL
jgi:hypothetical protein